MHGWDLLAGNQGPLGLREAGRRGEGWLGGGGTKEGWPAALIGVNGVNWWGGGGTVGGSATSGKGQQEVGWLARGKGVAEVLIGATVSTGWVEGPQEVAWQP